MKNPKFKLTVRVVSSLGTSFTSRRGARRLVSRGLAYEKAGELVMIESDPRFKRPAKAADPAWKECWLTAKAGVLRFQGHA